MPGSSSTNAFVCFARSSWSVVHFCPSRPTNCRESQQIAHATGGSGLPAYCVPHVTHKYAASCCGLLFAIADFLSSTGVCKTLSKSRRILPRPIPERQRRPARHFLDRAKHLRGPPAPD